MSTARPVAVLGAGIMGAATALHLSRRGVPVTLFDREHAPFCGASRWNEGKIHLGFLYAGDPSLETVRAVLPGGLDFKDQVERLTDRRIGDAITPDDDLYLIHSGSIAPAEAVARYFEAICGLIRGHPDARRYLADVSRAQIEPLSRDELEEMADPEAVVAGFRTPERSVNTNLVADAFVGALDAAPGVELVMGRAVERVSAAGNGDGRWWVHSDDGISGPFETVVNCLWSGRPPIDRSVGHRPDIAEHHRYRVSLFVRTATPVTTPSAVLAVGPFGDIKNYGGRDFYLSWYPAGLVVRAEAVEAPPDPQLSEAARAKIADEVFAELGAKLPWVGQVRDNADSIRVEGGWVYSQGRGALDDPHAGVHRRNRLGISRVDSYYSVDTGKYSVAPTLADELARMITGSR